MTNELMKADVSNSVFSVRNFDDLNNFGKIMYESGLFSDVKSASQAIVKIMAGKELGLGVFASMASLQVIKGNVTLSGNLLASKVKASEKYDYTVKHLADDGCIISFHQFRNEETILLGESKFDEGDAQRAGLLGKDNWNNYPRNMYFNRALSNGVKLYCPDICYGITVYSPEEMDFAIEGEFTISEDDLQVKEEPIKANKTAKVEDPTLEKSNPDWTSEQIAMLVELYPDKHVKNIVSTMSLSDKLTNETSQKDLEKWFKVYVAERKTHEPQESALKADSKLFG